MILSARSNVTDKVLGLDTVANDYLAKPVPLIGVVKNQEDTLMRRLDALHQ